MKIKYKQLLIVFISVVETYQKYCWSKIGCFQLFFSNLQLMFYKVGHMFKKIG